MVRSWGLILGGVGVLTAVGMVALRQAQPAPQRTVLQYFQLLAEDKEDPARMQTQDEARQPAPEPERAQYACIHEAARAGDEQAVICMLEAGADIEGRNEKGRTPLYEAALGQSLRVAELLISRGAEVNARDKSGYQPVHAAISAGAIEVLQLLDRRGADLNAPSLPGYTPLHCAASLKQPAAAEYLLDAGARIHALDDNGNTPLHWAAYNDAPECVRLLMAQGADPLICNASGAIPLTLAANQGGLKTIELILQKTSPNQYDAAGHTALSNAFVKRRIEVMTFLLERGANPNLPYSQVFYPLERVTTPEGVDTEPVVAELLRRYGAFRRGRPALTTPPFIQADLMEKDTWGIPRIRSRMDVPAAAEFRKYLEDGGDVHWADENGSTLLHWAAYNGVDEMVLLLIERGADVNAANTAGVTPLLCTDISISVATVQALIEAGADVNAADYQGMTILYQIMTSSPKSSLGLLLASGADVNTRTIYGDTPLHHAVDFRSTVSDVRLLLTHGANPNAQDYKARTPLHLACDEGSRALAEVLLQNGANPNAVDFAGRPPLHYAAASVPLMKLLLDSGADIHLRDHRRRTILHHVTMRKDRLEQLDFLLSRGLEVDVLDIEGATPLHQAAWTGAADAVKLLLSRGADPTRQNKYGTRPVDFARQRKHPQVAALLEKAVPGPVDESRKKKSLEVARQNDQARQADREMRKEYQAAMWARMDCSALHKAALLNDMDAIRILVEEGVDLDAFSTFEHHLFSPLDCAIFYNRLEAAEFLLKQGADVNRGDPANRIPPLQVALDPAAPGDIRMIRLLVENGARVDQPSRSGNTALRWAIITGNVRAIKYLVGHGADINGGRRERPGTAPLHEAACYKRPLQLVLDLGADVDIRDDRGRTPLHRAATCNDGLTETIRVLAEAGADVNARNNDGETPLHLAAASGYMDKVKAFIEAGADVNAATPDGQTVLHKHPQDPFLVELLLAAGVNLNAQTSRGETPLHRIAWKGPVGPEEERALAIYFAAGVDLNLTTHVYQQTPLHEAAMYGRPRLVELLLDNGADWRALDNAGNTPFHKGAIHAEVVRVFLEHGVDVNLRSRSGQTPLHTAFRRYNSPRDPRLAQIFVDAGADANARDEEGRTPLHMAAEAEIPEAAALARSLLKAGADPQIQDAKGRTPLQVAQALGRSSMIRLLESGQPSP